MLLEGKGRKWDTSDRKHLFETDSAPAVVPCAIVIKVSLLFISRNGTFSRYRNVQFRLEASPVDTPLRIRPILRVPAIGVLLIYRERLAAGQRLDEHLPGLDGPQGGHQIHAGQEEALRVYDAAAAEKHAHPLLGCKEVRLGGEEGRGPSEVCGELRVAARVFGEGCCDGAMCVDE